MAGNMKKFQAVIREITNFFVVSTFCRVLLLLWVFQEIDLFLVVANGQSDVSEVSEVESD